MPLLAVESDQQVGEDRGQLPEDVERDQVVAEDEGEHGPGEGEQVPGESGQLRGVVAEVRGAVEQDECADARREQHHEFGEGVQAQGDRDVVGGDPVPRPGDRVAGGRRVPLGERPAGGGGRGQRENHEGARAQPPHQRARARGEDEVADDERGHTTGTAGRVTEQTKCTKYRYIPSRASPVRRAARTVMDRHPLTAAPPRIDASASWDRCRNVTFRTAPRVDGVSVGDR